MTFAESRDAAAKAGLALLPCGCCGGTGACTCARCCGAENPMEVSPAECGVCEGTGVDLSPSWVLMAVLVSDCIVDFDWESVMVTATNGKRALVAHDDTPEGIATAACQAWVEVGK